MRLAGQAGGPFRTPTRSLGRSLQGLIQTQRAAEDHERGRSEGPFSGSSPRGSEREGVGGLWAALTDSGPRDRGGGLDLRGSSGGGHGAVSTFTEIPTP